MAEQMRNFRIGSQAKSALNHNMLCRMMPTRSQREEPQLRYVMVQRGKSLTFEPAEIEDLIHLEYGDKQVFFLLALLLPFVDLRNNFHIDHVFPISRFSRARLLKIGFGEQEVGGLAQHANQLPNRQLLDGAINNEKRASLPADLLAKHYPDPTSAHHYCEKHMLSDLPTDLSGFAVFHSIRQDRLRAALTKLLDAPPVLVGATEAA